MIAIEIFLVRFDEKFFSKVCLKIFEQGPTKKFQAGSGCSPGFSHDREKFHGSEFIQIRLTFYNQGLPKIFQSKSAEKISSKVWLIRIRFLIAIVFKKHENAMHFQQPFVNVLQTFIHVFFVQNPVKILME
jgi:hypothetical protein